MVYDGHLKTGVMLYLVMVYMAVQDQCETVMGVDVNDRSRQGYNSVGY